MTTSPPVHHRSDIPGLRKSEDRLLAMIAGLASELATVRERLDTLERIAENAGLIDRAAIEAFEPTADQEEERGAMRRRLIAKIFRPIRDEAERAATMTESKE